MKIVPNNGDMNDIHVKDVPEAVRLIVPGDDADKAKSVLVYDGAEGVRIPNPGDVMQWVKATSYLLTRAYNRLDQLKAEHARPDLCHVIRWAIPAAGNELHCEMKVSLP